MTTITLLVKAAHGGQLRAIDEALKTQFEELDAQIEVLSNQANRWVQVEVSGEDEPIATSYIKKTYGTCPVTLENAKAEPTLKGYISKVDLSKQELRVDVGVFEPKAGQAIVSVACLQEQLAGGQKLPLQKIAEHYALADRVPLTVEVNWTNSAEEEFSSRLSVDQVEKLSSWRRSLLDRLLILGASKEHIEEVIERTRLGRDIVDVEVLGAFEYALTCKLGTDAAGLVPRMGRYMRNSVFVVFSAKKAWMGMDFSGEKGLTL